MRVRERPVESEKQPPDHLGFPWVRLNIIYKTQRSGFYLIFFLSLAGLFFGEFQMLSRTRIHTLLSAFIRLFIYQAQCQVRVYPRIVRLRRKALPTIDFCRCKRRSLP